MNEITTSSMDLSSRNELKAAVSEAARTVGKSFEKLCLLAGVDALATMMDDDVNELAGKAYGHNSGKPGYRWGRIKLHILGASLERHQNRNADASLHHQAKGRIAMKLAAPPFALFFNIERDIPRIAPINR